MTFKLTSRVDDPTMNCVRGQDSSATFQKSKITYTWDISQLWKFQCVHEIQFHIGWNALGVHFYSLWETSTLFEWAYNGGSYQFVIFHFLSGFMSIFNFEVKICEGNKNIPDSLHSYDSYTMSDCQQQFHLDTKF